jgi:hypothetical protein
MAMMFSLHAFKTQQISVMEQTNDHFLTTFQGIYQLYRAVTQGISITGRFSHPIKNVSMPTFYILHFHTQTAEFFSIQPGKYTLVTHATLQAIRAFNGNFAIHETIYSGAQYCG